MPLADLLASLERDAADEIRAVTALADADVARIDAECARACGDQLAAAVRTATEEQRAAADTQLAEAERRWRKSVLEARAAMLARLRDAVRAELPALVDEALRARLAAAAAVHGEGTVRQVPTGVIVELPDGTRIDATLDALLDRLWPRLAGEALAAIDAEGS